MRKDGTLDIDGKTWQLDQSFLAGALVTVAVDLTGTAAPIVEHDDRRYVLRPVDAIAAGKTRRKRPQPERKTTVLLLLEAAAAVAANALRAQHVQIEGDYYDGETNELTTARVLAHECELLRETLDDYRRRVLAQLAHERDQWPF